MIRETSLLAYMELGGDLMSARQREVLRALKALGKASDMMIARYLGYSDPNKVRPRRNKLTEIGLVIDRGVEPCAITKRTVHYWSIRKGIGQ